MFLEAGRAGAIDGGHRGIGVCQPLHQPLHLAVAVERVAPQVPDREGDGGDTEKTVSQLSAHPPKPSSPSFSSRYDLPNAGSHTTPSWDTPLCGTVKRARTQALQVTQDVQGPEDVSRQCLQVIVGQ